MLAALALIAGLALGALVVAVVLLRRDPPPPPEAPDLGPAIQEATSKAVADLQRMNEESRKIDAQSSEAALQKREAEFRNLTKPIGENLKRIEREVSTLRSDRREADGAMKSLLGEMKVGLGDLGTQTSTLVKALRQPRTRGEWGEVQLKRCVEIAGMTEHVDFELQKTLRGEDSLLRPDAVVMLPAGRRVVVDSKVPLDAYLEVLEADDEAARQGELMRHARQVRDHVTKLSSKRYQDQFDAGETPDFVVCFIPSEAALHAAFEAKPDLYDYALEQKILIATPTTLVGLLRTIELGWRQERIAAEAQEIASAAKDLHSRMGVFLDHYAKAGGQLESAVKSYNKAVGSMETRVLPQMRRFQELGAASGEDRKDPKRIDHTVRPVIADELREIEEGEEAEEAQVGLPATETER